VSYVVNDRGDYLVHPDPAANSASSFGKPAHIQQEFPALASMLAADDAGAARDRRPLRQALRIAIEFVHSGGRPRVAVIQTVPYSVLTAATKAVRDSSLMGGALAAFCAFRAGADRRPLA